MSKPLEAEATDRSEAEPPANLFLDLGALQPMPSHRAITERAKAANEVQVSAI